MTTNAITRRGLIARASILAASGFLAPWTGTAIANSKSFGDTPFKLGIASGDPVSDGFVLWTRLAPFPFDSERAGREPVVVQWRVAEDEKMRKLVVTGSELARPDRAFAVHAEVRGLPPNRPYWYQFSTGREESAVGRAITAPILRSPLQKLRFAFASCQHYEQGYFTAYREMLSDAPDLVVHHGDYIYESSWGDPARRHEGPEPFTLDQYRARHALYKTEPHLQAMHAACPFLLTWDDHEVENDWAGDVSEKGTPASDFVQRRSAAFQAYWEHMPLRLSQALYGTQMNLTAKSQWGDLLSFAIVDTRQFRSPEACPLAPNRRGAHLAPFNTCKELKDEKRTMLGAAQEMWLARMLAAGGVTWNVLAQSVLFAGLLQKDAEGQIGGWTDTWDGYPNARKRLLDRIVEAKVANPVVLTGDIHSFWANDVKHDYRDAASPVVASEFVSGSISAAPPPYQQFASQLPLNPHVKFFESRKQGYGLCDVTPAHFRTEFRTVENVRDPNTTGGSLGAWVVEAGKPGPIPA